MFNRVLVLALFFYFVVQIIFAQNSTVLKEKERMEKIYYHNYSQAQRNCINDIIGNRSFRLNKNRLLNKVNYILYAYNNSDEETKCYFGCVFKRMKIINGSNFVDDDNLRKFSDFITYSNPNITEDIDDDCADLELKFKKIDYCQMGFELGVCISKVLDKVIKKG